jgi:uncharacterized LabA/DUF88 family protein
LKNIAIFFDIENLVGGYSMSSINELSLKEISKQISTDIKGGVAVQKAYADWSNHKLNKLRWDISDLGIEPIQMFGFSKGATKNASDIQLVIDVMETLFLKDFITTFVIVSGDGGFSSIAKKLKEHGKHVVGVSFKDASSIIFEKVCDHFIHMENIEPKKEIKSMRDVELDENLKIQFQQDSRLQILSSKISQISGTDLEEIEQAKKIIKVFSKFDEHKGINISTFKTALNYGILDFNYHKFGFGKFVDFIRYTILDTDMKLVLKEPSDYRLLKKSISGIKGFQPVPELTEFPKVDSFETYKSILSSGKPNIRVPEKLNILISVIEKLSIEPEKYRDVYFDDLLEEMLVFAESEEDEKDVRKVLYLLVNTEVLLGDKSDEIISNQHYYFKCSNYDEVIEVLKDRFANKIEMALNREPNRDVIEEFFQKRPE